MYNITNMRRRSKIKGYIWDRNWWKGEESPKDGRNEKNNEMVPRAANGAAEFRSMLN